MAHKLLLADDSITIQKVVELILAEEDYDIKSVSNGEDALNALETFKPEIILADIDMPKINGYQLCERIKKNPSTATIPVILLAGAFEPIDETLAREAGAEDSIIKPFESQELISKINAALTIVSAGEQEGIEAEAVAESDDEALEVLEDSDIGVEAEAIMAETTEADEDLWSMDDMTLPAGDEILETGTAEETGSFEEAFEMPDEEAPEQEPEPVFREPTPQRDFESPRAMPAPAMLSNEEMRRIFEKTVDDRISAFVSTLDIREPLLASLMPQIKDSIEKILWEVAPELVERMLKEILKGSIASLTSEVEKVIWETVPDLANTMISREIEKIRSEF